MKGFGVKLNYIILRLLAHLDILVKHMNEANQDAID